MGKFNRKSWNATSRDKKLIEIAKIITAFYKKHGIVASLTDKKIIDELGVIPSDLQALKKEAAKEYIRKFDNLLIPPRDEYLERELKKRFKKYGLTEARVFNQDIDSNTDPHKGVGKVAARFFEENVKTDSSIVFSCGSTINQMIQNLDDLEKNKRLTLYSSIVLCKNKIERLSPPTLIHNCTQQIKSASGITFHLPENIRNKLKKEEIANLLNDAVFSKAMNADFFFLGIGALRKKNDAGLSGGFLSMVNELNCFDSFKSVGCCGEISYCPLIDPKKNPTPWLQDRLAFYNRDDLNSFFDHVYTLDFKQLIEKKKNNKNFKGKIVAIASGKNKIDPILVCLTMNSFLDVFITSSETAQYLLQTA